MEAYEKECAERERSSLEFKRKEANVQRLEEKRKQQGAFEVDQRWKMLPIVMSPKPFAIAKIGDAYPLHSVPRRSVATDDGRKGSSH